MEGSIKIPKISDKKLRELSQKIQPIISLTKLPLGRWPIDVVETYFLVLPRNLRENNFLEMPTGKKVRVTRLGVLQTLHTRGSGGRVFHPTIAEVLAQIPENLHSCSSIIGFETFLPNRDPEEDASGEYHVATTVLLAKASAGMRLLGKYHHT